MRVHTLKNGNRYCIYTVVSLYVKYNVLKKIVPASVGLAGHISNDNQAAPVHHLHTVGLVQCLSILDIQPPILDLCSSQDADLSRHTFKPAE